MRVLDDLHREGATGSVVTYGPLLSQRHDLRLIVGAPYAINVAGGLNKVIRGEAPASAFRSCRQGLTLDQTVSHLRPSFDPYT
jgi:hypothetical protein